MFARIAGMTALFLACACATRTQRVATPPEPIPFPATAVAPAPQVVVAAPRTTPDAVVLAGITEAQRRDLLLQGAPAIQAYAPPSPESPPPQYREVRNVVVERGWCNEHYCDYGSCHDQHGDPWFLPRVATYGIAGAVIGHQYHHQGEGAAIGIGLGILTSPLWWCWH